jgi:hypothetical protein
MRLAFFSTFYGEGLRHFRCFLLQAIEPTLVIERLRK